MSDINSDNTWHWSKSVPISLIFAILMQSFAAIWWASSVTRQIEDLSKQIGEVKVITDSDRQAVGAENLRQWARINANEDNIQRLSAMNSTLTAILERLEAQVKENNSILKEYLRGTERRTK